MAGETFDISPHYLLYLMDDVKEALQARDIGSRSNQAAEDIISDLNNMYSCLAVLDKYWAGTASEAEFMEAYNKFRSKRGAVALKD